MLYWVYKNAPVVRNGPRTDQERYLGLTHSLCLKTGIN